MVRLALDTSTRLGSVALAADGELLAETTLPVRATRSESVLPEVDEMLASCGVDRDRLDGVVVGAGPGSFTGVRIAASLAKGLCFGTDRALYAFSSLLTVAAGLGRPDRVCALFDARRGDVYAAAWRSLDPPARAAGPVVEPIGAFLDRLDAPDRWTFAGDGALLHRGRIEERGGWVAPFPSGHPRGSVLLWLAGRWPEAGRVESPADWEPRYARESGARRASSGVRAGTPEPEGSGRR